MISKILPFNKTLFKKDWKLIGWWSYLATLFLFFVVPLHNIRTLNRIYEIREVFAANGRLDWAGSSWFFGAYRTMDVATLQQLLEWYLSDGFKQIFLFWGGPGGEQWFLIFFFPFFIAVALIGEERRRKTFNFLSVLPYTRGEIFFNKIIVGCLALSLPYAINSVLMYLMRYTNEYIGSGYAAADISSWLLASFVSMIAIFAFGIFVGMITGSSLAQFVFSVILLFSPAAFWDLIQSNLRLWGVPFLLPFQWGAFAESVTLPYRLIDERQFLSERVFQIMPSILLFTVVCIILAKLFFDRSKMERNGEVLMFGNLEKLFRCGVTICAALALGPFWGDILTLERSIPVLIISYIISAVLSWVITGYLIARSRAAA